jgi:hypothetical protein
MEWLNDIKEKFSRRRIRNLDRTKEYARDFIDLDSARRIGLIVNCTEVSEEDFQTIKAYADALVKRKKQLLVIEINYDKKAEPRMSGYDAHVFVNAASLNWLDYPNPAVENQVRQYEMDILIDLDISPRMASKYLCSIARAKTRTGIHQEGLESCYELMIERDEEPLLKNMIKEFDYFLNMIDNGNKVKA